MAGITAAAAGSAYPAPAAPTTGCGWRLEARTGAADSVRVLYFTGPHPAVDRRSRLGGSRAWYLASRPIDFRGERYVKFGWPLSTRATAPNQRGVRVRHVGQYDGVPVYAEEPTTGKPSQVWVQLDEVCHFQPYATAAAVQ